MPEVGAKPIIALDADGVLLDYHAAYRRAWGRAFGALPELRDPDAYWPIDRWDVRHLEGDELIRFRTCFDQDYWASIPAIPGAVRACEDLCEAGYTLVCVSALESHFQEARLQNLRCCGFPIERVIATANMSIGRSPKSEALRALRPVCVFSSVRPPIPAATRPLIPIASRSPIPATHSCHPILLQSKPRVTFGPEPRQPALD